MHTSAFGDGLACYSFGRVARALAATTLGSARLRFLFFSQD